MDYQPLLAALRSAGATDWAESLPNQIDRAFNTKKQGALQQWLTLVDQLPVYHGSYRDLLHRVEIGSSSDLTREQQDLLIQLLKGLCPWRKGPFDVFGIHIDSEWRSDWKWERLENHVSPLAGRRVLDVGCGNGYHSWRMYGAGAALVIGIDPMMLSVLQFHAIKKMYGNAPVYVLPFGIEDIPPQCHLFDTVFSMGVLYHRRSPIDHLLELKACLRTGGELVLETLLIEGKANEVLVPADRYAQMRNVWFIPSSETLMGWLSRCGFNDIRLINQTKTSFAEQRSTDWMTSHSLRDFLDPTDAALTVEGLPAPVRAIFIAKN